MFTWSRTRGVQTIRPSSKYVIVRDSWATKGHAMDDVVVSMSLEREHWKQRAGPVLVVAPFEVTRQRDRVAELEHRERAWSRAGLEDSVRGFGWSGTFIRRSGWSSRGCIIGRVLT